MIWLNTDRYYYVLNEKHSVAAHEHKQWCDQLNDGVKIANPKKYKLFNDWKVWYQFKAKNASRLHRILLSM